MQRAAVTTAKGTAISQKPRSPDALAWRKVQYASAPSSAPMAQCPRRATYQPAPISTSARSRTAPMRAAPRTKKSYFSKPRASGWM